MGVAPVEDPQYLVAVTLQRPQGDVRAIGTTPTFSKIMGQVLRHYDVPPSTTEPVRIPLRTDDPEEDESEQTAPVDTPPGVEAPEDGSTGADAPADAEEGPAAGTEAGSGADAAAGTGAAGTGGTAPEASRRADEGD